jgi:4-hydroxybenzoate polyprenyltransferase
MTDINTKKHTDIKRLAWIEILPEQIRPYAYAMRLDRPIGIWLLLLPALWSIALASGGILSMNAHSYITAILFTLGAVIMRAAGCVINDIWDRKIDAKVERTKHRPIASGEVSLKQALALLAALLTIGLIILIQFNNFTIVLGVISLPFIIAYPLMKRFMWWPQAFLGLTFNFGALMGWSAITGSLGVTPIVLYIGGIFWTLAYDTIYAHQDMEDDMRVGVKSTALRLGNDSKKWVADCFTISFAFIAIALHLASGELAIRTTLIVLLGLHFIWQIKKWEPDDQASSLRYFKSNRDAGLFVLLACL